jgi:hypothetical protein
MVAPRVAKQQSSLDDKVTGPSAHCGPPKIPIYPGKDDDNTWRKSSNLLNIDRSDAKTGLGLPQTESVIEQIGTRFGRCHTIDGALFY